MGFPATMGAHFLPYAIVDAVVAPRHPKEQRSDIRPCGRGAVLGVDVAQEDSRGQAGLWNSTSGIRRAAPRLELQKPQKGECFSETLIRMPNSYFVNSYQSAYPITDHGGKCGMGLGDSLGDEYPTPPQQAPAFRPTLPTRAELGLPERGVVYCCTNQVGGTMFCIADPMAQKIAA